MIKIRVCDMRAAGKPGYVARVVGSDRQFLNAASYEGHGSSAKHINYEISESESGIYEICDANYGGRKRSISYMAVNNGEFSEFYSLQDAILWMEPKQPAIEPIKVETVVEPDAAKPDVRIKSITQHPNTAKARAILRVENLSGDASKYFLPKLKQHVPDREWNEGKRAWDVPVASAMFLREQIEACSIRTEGIRKPLRFELSNAAKTAMAIDW